MRDLWNVYKQDIEVRNGIRLRFEKNIEDEVKRSCIEFINWIRFSYIFPVRVVIYFKNSDRN